MTTDSNTHPHDDLAVYALDALDPDERTAVEEHLAGCPACRAELDRHLDTLAGLTTAEDPPPHLWDRIAGGIAAEPRPDVRPEPGAGGTGSADVFSIEQARETRELRPRSGPRHAAPGRRRLGPRWLNAVAAAAAVVVVLGGVALWSLRADDTPQGVEDLALAALDDADSTVVTLTTGDGDPQARVVLADDGQGYVLFDELPELPQGRSYQLWKMDDVGDPVSLGVLGDGSEEAAAFAAPDDSTSFAISDEIEEGVPLPKGPIVATGSLD